MFAAGHQGNTGQTDLNKLFAQTLAGLMDKVRTFK